MARAQRAAGALGARRRRHARQDDHSSLLAWILEHAGLEPGFLVGGVPLDFNVSARLGAGRHFVVEADEYDTAFFDSGPSSCTTARARRS